jgi:hypothetical protein
MSETLSQARLRQCSQNTQRRSRSRTLYRSGLTGCDGTLTRCGSKSNIGECSDTVGGNGQADDLPGVHRGELEARNIWREGCTTYISIRCTRNSHRVRCGAFQTQLLRPSKNWIQFRNLRRLPGAISAGFSGQAIIPALLAGERDLKALAKLRDPRGQASEQEIVRVSRRGKTISASL